MFRFAVLLLGAACGSPAQTPAAVAAIPEPATLTGAVRGTGGEPIFGARLRLRSTVRGDFETVSEGTGAFEFSAIPPGEYYLIGSHDGYSGAYYGQRADGARPPVMELLPGERRSGLDFRLRPTARIEGRVTDDAGGTLAGAKVTLYRRIYSGAHRLTFYREGVSRQDGGFEFEDLAGGHYFVSAASPEDGNAQDPDEKAEPAWTLVETFYPRVTSPLDAVPVEVAAGTNSGGIEIGLRKEAVYRISGRVEAPPEVTASWGIQLDPEPESVFRVEPYRVTRATGEDDAFAFEGLLPGSYTLSLLTYPQLGPAGFSRPPGLVGRTVITIGSEDVDDAVLVAMPPTEVRGSVVLTSANEDNEQELDPSGIVVRIMPDPNSSRDQHTPVVSKDGSFEAAVAPGSYAIHLQKLAEELYLQRIRYNGQDVTRSAEIEVGGERIGRLEIEVARGAGSVNGVLRDEDGEALEGYGVVLWIPANANGGMPRWVGSSTPGADGQFRFGNLAPGEYRIAAWLPPEVGLDRFPEFLRLFESRATEVKVGEEQQATVAPVLIEARELGLAAARVR